MVTIMGCLDLKMWLIYNKVTVRAMTKNVCCNHKWALLNLHPACLLWVLTIQALQLMSNSHTASAKLAKLRGRGHSSAQLWQTTNNSLLQIVHVFQGNTVSWGTFTPYSQLGQELPEGYPKNLSPYFIRTKKLQPCSSCEKMLFHDPFQQLLDTSEHSLHHQDRCDSWLCPQLVAGQQGAADPHLLPAPFQTPPCQLSWTSFLDAFPLP